MPVGKTPQLGLGSALSLRRVLLATLFCLSGTAASAQEPAALDAPAAVHTLQIRGGHVHLDGERLPADAVPARLDLRGLDFVMEYSGSVAPVLTIHGDAYVLEGRRLVPFEDVAGADAGVQVYGLGRPDAAPASDVARAADASRAADAAPVARAAAPAVGSEEAYLMRLSERDRRLYDLIQEERTREADALALAQRVRRTADADRRADLVDDLRAQLDAIFALKQTIRRAELERADAQLDTLRARLAERDARRGAIVEGRLRSLVGDR